MMVAVMDVVPLEPVLETIGVFVFGLSGGLTAVRKQFDLVGVFVLAWATALGGGFLRDIFIGALPPVGISDWRLFGTAVLGGIVAFFFHPGLVRIRRTVLVLDAGGLALFTVAGTLKALEFGNSPALACIVVGVLTGVGGGVIRDMLCSEVPGILHKGELYAIPAALGAVVVVGLSEMHWLGTVTATCTVVGIFMVRILALRFRWQAPRSRAS